MPQTKQTSLSPQQKISFLIDYFLQTNPYPQTELQYDNPYQLLVAVILSAQCTDKRVNSITPHFFSAFPTIEALSEASFDMVFDKIKSISYPNNKSRHLINMAVLVLQNFAGKIPLNVTDLITLPGVGRKTANVISSVLADQPNMAVDTHVFRVSHRLGLVSSKASTPLSVERILVALTPSEIIPKMHHWLILHGRYTCKAKNPLCQSCHFNQWCNYYKKQIKK